MTMKIPIIDKHPKLQERCDHGIQQSPPPKWLDSFILREWLQERGFRSKYGFVSNQILPKIKLYPSNFS
jgi:hypothetical protein